MEEDLFGKEKYAHRVEMGLVYFDTNPRSLVAGVEHENITKTRNTDIARDGSASSCGLLVFSVQKQPPILIRWTSIPNI